MPPRTIRAAGWVLVLLSGAMVQAAEPPPTQRWVVEGKLFGKPAKDGNPDGKDAASDVSGLACAPPGARSRLCLLVDDESQGAQIVVVHDGRLVAGDFIRLSTAAFDGKPLELDAEAAAWADGAFYVVGSPGRPRHGKPDEEPRNVARAAATRSVYEVRLPADDVDAATGRLRRPATIRASARLSEAIVAQPGLSPSFDRALDEGGVTIEGAAVRDAALVVGFRGPVPGGAAAALSVPLATLFGATPATGSLLPLQLGADTLGRPRGVRDLVAVDSGYVGIAGPVNDPPDDGTAISSGDYALFWWSGAAAPIVRNLGGFPSKMKPEAVVPLALTGRRLRALLLFDGAPGGGPVEVDQDFAAPGAPPQRP